MRICHLTPHLPPDQAANALLPLHLGTWSRDAGDTVDYIAYAPRQSPDKAACPLPGSVTWLSPRRQRSRVVRALRFGSLVDAARLIRVARTRMAAADIVHLHSNGLLTDVGALVASSLHKPIVLTLYGTEIWHYRPRAGLDLFTRAYRHAQQITFYSQGLLDRARVLGLDRAGLRVVYPPVAPHFVHHDSQMMRAVRASLGITEHSVLVNVKRLHPLAAQHVLLDAMPSVLAAEPDTRLVFCGSGPLAARLQEQASRLGVAGRVTFAGVLPNDVVARYHAAADLFVLPSELEACPTVAVEALACGTPVVSSDNPGGIELCALGLDVTVVPRNNSAALADAILARLASGARAEAATADIIAREFSPVTVAARFSNVYRDARLAAGADHRQRS